ncbi:uncharacterized protein DUF898 [Roseovarius halotolerans]|uniref:Inner membrane protein YjgN n=1 Tax=Roseovarius halotolerans TaxID=505353 RepID=A0A1X6YSY9_9RHOB|nr:DUF898 family protein [Roseovarius halotolerans]RKT32962.1 uncharacterized protein DUF898 [Roseovarius halotolerans]SLN30111.1 hypothetical protein ROH8110_01393 [Roseovarius halotolerans]
MSEGSQIIKGHYQGQRGPLFGLAFVTALLTMLTLGIYRFWGKTRIRRYIWSSVSGDGDSFEYTGTGLEKFLGFLVAIVLLAVYLGAVQMILFFFGLTLFAEPTSPEMALAQMGGFYLTFLAVVPLIFFAQYRARRYKLARSRWRGVRFGAEKGAWGYALRAMGHWLLTILTLGLMLPRQTFWLEKYKTDRSWYGDGRFVQEGRWSALYGAMKHLFIGVGLVLAAVVALALQSPVVGGVLAAVGYVWAMVGFISYRVRAFIYLTEHKVLDDGIRFEARPETRTIIGLVIVGSLVVSLIMGVVFAVLAALASMVVGPAMMAPGPGHIVGLVLMMGLYLGALLMGGALSLVWIVQPVIAHVVGAITVRGADRLADIRQRVHDSGADAEGFADALDVGGAI